MILADSLIISIYLTSGSVQRVLDEFSNKGERIVINIEYQALENCVLVQFQLPVLKNISSLWVRLNPKSRIVPFYGYPGNLPVFMSMPVSPQNCSMRHLVYQPLTPIS